LDDLNDVIVHAQRPALMGVEAIFLTLFRSRCVVPSFWHSVIRLLLLLLQA
jgi:hypothetical protein